MAIKRVESFDHWVTADAPKKGWALQATPVVSAGNGRNATASLRTTGPGSTTLSRALLGVTNTGRTGVVGFAFRTLGGQSLDMGLVAIYEGATIHLDVRLLTTGALRVSRANGAAVLGTSASTPITPATYHFIEVAFNIHDTTGTYDVRVNGVSVVSGTGADTQNTGTGIWNGIGWWGLAGSTSANTCEIDDIYVADDTTFRGDHRIMALLPSTGNGTHTAWTPSTGTDHGALVDEASPNTTDYVTSSSAGAIDTYNFPAVGVAGTVAGVQISHYSKAEVAGVRTVVPAYRIGGADQVGTGGILASDWVYATEFAAVSPATSVAWTVAEIDAAEFGVKLTV